MLVGTMLINNAELWDIWYLFTAVVYWLLFNENIKPSRPQPLPVRTHDPGGPDGTPSMYSARHDGELRSDRRRAWRS